MSTTTTPELEKSICVVGAGAAGLITAHVLLQDGFKNVQLITRDHTPGGVWASERVYPGLTINNVHGEFRFSSLPMPPSADPDGHLSGEDMRQYMQSFADRNLKNKITFDTEVLKISRQSRSTEEQNWCINVVNKLNGESRDIRCDRIVMCSGGCSRPNVPEAISPDAATRAGFKGPVFHSTSLRARMDELLESVNPLTAAEPGHAVVIGGGKSAQDVAAFLANQGRRVSIVFETTDAVLAAPIPFPDFIRKSRFLPIISPHCVLRTRLERFLHGTWLGGKIVRGIWDAIAFASYSALKVPRGSPLRNAHSTFWATRTNDEGIILPHRFHGLVAAGKIELIAPARASHFNENGRSIVLEDGRNVPADAVVLATGWKNSWDGIFDDVTVEEIGLNSYVPDQNISAEVDASIDTYWKSLSGSPPLTSTKLRSQRTAAIHRGIVPAKNIDKHDFAINGAIFTSNNGYTLEVGAHWIASYFRKDPFLSLPPSPADAMRKAEFHNAWLMRRFPGMHEWANSSYSGDLPFFNWPQAMDTLLEDMGLPIMRSGGNWLTWPFKVIDLKEIEHLTEEREAKRAAYDPTV